MPETRTTLTDPGLALRESLGPHRRPVLAAGLVITGFLLLPVLVILATSVTTQQFLSLPTDGLSRQWYAEFLRDPLWREPLTYSLRISAIATVLATVLGTMAALGLRRAGRWGSYLKPALVAPLVLPHIVYAMGLFNVADQHYPEVSRFYFIVAGQAIMALPLVVLTVSAGLAQVNPDVIRAAESLGARWFTVLFKVELPLIKGSIIAAAIFAFAFTFDELIIALFLAEPGVTTLPVQIFRAAQESVSPVVAAASTVVMTVALISLSVVALADHVRRRRPEELS